MFKSAIKWCNYIAIVRCFNKTKIKSKKLIFNPILNSSLIFVNKFTAG